MGYGRVDEVGGCRRCCLDGKDEGDAWEERDDQS